MPPLILYLLKVNAVLLLFALAYYLVLRSLTFYKVNRFILLFGLLFSSLYPFIDLTNLFYSRKNIQIPWEQYVPSASLDQITSPGDGWQVVVVVFFAGMLVMLMRFFMQLLSLRKIHSRSIRFPALGGKVRVLNEKIYPFTFLQNIYINPALHAEEELKLILEHEKVHVQQWHTVDILVSQLGGVFYWFNPGVWFIKIFIRENLEFLADDAVIKKGVKKKQYQYNVLRVESGLRAISLTNGFSLSGVKRRIRMMNSGPSAKAKLLIYFVLLPVIILFSLAFTISKAQPETAQVTAEESVKTEPPKEIPETAMQPVTITGKQSSTGGIKTTRKTEKKTVNKAVAKETEIANRADEALLFSGSATSAADAPENTTITVVGYSSRIARKNKISKSDSANQNGSKIKLVKLNGVPVSKEEDLKNIKITYFKNGVKISEDEVAKIERDNIRELSVFKNSDGSGEIHLKVKE